MYVCEVMALRKQGPKAIRHRPELRSQAERMLLPSPRSSQHATAVLRELGQRLGRLDLVQRLLTRLQLAEIETWPHVWHMRICGLAS